MPRVEFHAMGSRMLAILEAEASEAENVVLRVPDWFEEWEQALSRFRFDSELSRLNRSNGRPVKVSQILWEVFHTALEAERVTGGLVTPKILDSMIEAGYDRSFETLPGEQTSHSPKLFPAADISTAIGWDEATHTLNLPVTIHLDFGGIAKGWAAHCAAQRLAGYGPALVDAGGDIAISGLRSGGDPWPVGINNPFEKDSHFDTLRLGCCGVATSGKDYHRWLKDGAWQHHIIDPRTGVPAVTDVLAATVVAPTVIQAEAAAKAALILGSRNGLDWLESDPALAGVLVLDDGGVVYSRRMDQYLWR